MTEQTDNRMLVVREAFRALYSYQLHILSLVRAVATSLPEYRWGGITTEYGSEDELLESWSPSNLECCVLSGTPILDPYFQFYRNRSNEDGRERFPGDEFLVLEFVADDALITADDEEGKPLPMSSVLTGAQASRSYLRLALARCIASSSGEGKGWDSVWSKIEFADYEWQISAWPKGKKPRYRMVYQDLDESISFDEDTVVPATKAFVEKARAILESDANQH